MNFRHLAAASFLLGVPGVALADDRAPNADERAKIEAALKVDGFTAWGDIELDDGRVWEVDDARHTDGKEYDVDLHLTTYAILKRDPD